MSYIYIVSFALILYFSVTIVSKPGKSISEKIFTGWVFLLAITELSFFFYAIGLFHSTLLLFSIICDTHVLHGVLFYFYVRSFIEKSFRFKPVHGVHLIPFFVLLALKIYLNAVSGVIDCYGSGCIHSDNRYVDLLVFLKFFILGGYLLAGWNQVYEYRLRHDNAEGVLRIRINWLHNVTIGVSLLFSLAAVYKILYRLEFGFLGNDIHVVNILTSFFILVFLYMGNSYAYMFVSPGGRRIVALDDDSREVRGSGKKSVETVPAVIEDPERKFTIIERFLKRETPFLEGQFTLRELAERIDIPTQEISQIINLKTGKYYCDFMNDFRVEALKQKLDDPQYDKYTVLALGLECGFASKTSLNRIFKNATGLTPSEYRALQRGETAPDED